MKNFNTDRRALYNTLCSGWEFYKPSPKFNETMIELSRNASNSEIEISKSHRATKFNKSFISTFKKFCKCVFRKLRFWKRYSSKGNSLRKRTTLNSLIINDL